MKAVAGILGLCALVTGTTGCCQDLRLDSLGLSHYEQSSRVGEYSYYKTELSGKFTYRQAGGDNFLYYMPDLKIWMVGEELYANYGGILNRNINDCPEDFITPWEYWYEFMNEWTEDALMEARCVSGGGGGGNTDPPPVDAEDCTTGTYCLSCSTTTTIEGVLYCCENDCNSGWIEGGSDNGEPWCRCGHD